MGTIDEQSHHRLDEHTQPFGAPTGFKGKVLGYVVATHHFGGGYVVPLEDTFRDNERRLGLRWVEPPSPGHIAVANRAVKGAEERSQARRGGHELGEENTIIGSHRLPETALNSSSATGEHPHSIPDGRGIAAAELGLRVEENVARNKANSGYDVGGSSVWEFRLSKTPASGALKA
ncbi:hypothetical protein DL767_009165 [Monosporascus sp. MG133]|nr:hypothetical protein DL767_009165 [Monosporascus sp. MG133]